MESYTQTLQGMGAILGVEGLMPNAVIGAPHSVITLAGLTNTTGKPIRKPAMLETLPILHTSQVPTNSTTGTSADTSQVSRRLPPDVFPDAREREHSALARSVFLYW